MVSKKSQFIILAIILAGQIILRLLLSAPIDMDEAIYGYFGQRILAGDVPYRDVFDHKVPGIFFIYALIIKLAGNSIISIRLVALFFTLLTTIVIFLIGKLIWHERAALWAAAFHGIFINGFIIQGTTANTEIFINFFSILSLWFFLLANKAENRNDFLVFLSGLLAGLSFMTKPVAIFNFFVLFVFTLFFKKSVLKRILYLLLGFFGFPLIFSLYFLIKSALVEYLSYAFIINRDYLALSQSFLFSLIDNLKMGVAKTSSWIHTEAFLLWLTALGGLWLIFIKGRTIKNYLAVSWLLFSGLGVALGGAYLPHYYIQLVPALALLGGFFLAEILKEKWLVKIPLILKIIILAYFLFAFMILGLQYKGRFIAYKKNGDIYDQDSSFISQQLKIKTQPNDYLFIWPRTPEIYFLSQRKSASQFIFYPSWAEEKLNIKNKIIIELNKNHPVFIVLDPFLNTDECFRFEELYNFIEKYYQPEETISPYLNIQSWKIFKHL